MNTFEPPKSRSGNGKGRRAGRRELPAAGQAGHPHEQVLLHGEAREDLAPLGHVGDAGANAVVRGRAGEVLSVERHLAGRDLERHVPQDVAAAVVLVDVVEHEHGQRPR